MCLFVTPLPLGIESARGLLLPLISRNSTIPTRKTVRLRWDDAVAAFLPAAAAAGMSGAAVGGDAAGAAVPMRSVPLRIFMGERALAADNIHLGDATIVLTGDAPVEESGINKQTALMAIGVLSDQLAPHHPKHFQAMLPAVVRTIAELAPSADGRAAAE